MIVLDERHLSHIFSDYVRYYDCSRTHPAPETGEPEARVVRERDLAEAVTLLEVGDFTNRYERRAA